MTVMYVATIFAQKELKIPEDGLIITLLLIQLVAIPGAYLFSILSSKFGNSKTLKVIIFIWVGITIMAYFTANAMQFYVLASVVGLVMGGVQSLSRSTFAKLLPENTPDTASYFGVYDIVEKSAIMFRNISFWYNKPTYWKYEKLRFIFRYFICNWLFSIA